MARLRTHAHELPVRGQKHLKQRMQRVSANFRLAAENIAMDKVYRLLGRPIAMGYQGCNFTSSPRFAPAERQLLQAFWTPIPQLPVRDPKPPQQQNS